MTHGRLIIGLAALAAAALCVILGFTKIGGTIGTGTWTAYPAAGFALVAAIQIYQWLSTLLKPRVPQDS